MRTLEDEEREPPSTSDVPFRGINGTVTIKRHPQSILHNTYAIECKNSRQVPAEATMVMRAQFIPIPGGMYLVCVCVCVCVCVYVVPGQQIGLTYS